MVRRKIGVLFLLVLTALIGTLLATCSVLAEALFKNGGGRIADGIDAPFGSAIYAYASAADKPVIKSISIVTGNDSEYDVKDDVSAEEGTDAATYTLTAGSEFKVALTLEDTELTFPGAAVVFKCIATNTTISAGSDTTALIDGKYIKVVIPDSTKGGVYIIERIALKDSEGRVHIYKNPKIFSGDDSAQTVSELTEAQRLAINVKAKINDTQAPEIGLIEIEKSSAVPSEELLFAIEAKDETQTVKNVFYTDVSYAASGLNTLKITWQRVSSDGEQILLGKYTFSTTVAFADMKKNGDSYQGTFKVPARLIEGVYFIKSVEVSDLAGNIATYINPDIVGQQSDGELVLLDEVCDIYINVSSEQSQSTDDTDTAKKSVTKSLTKSSATESSGTATDESVEETVIIPVIESFELNSFGKMAAYVILKGDENDEELDGLDDDTYTYATQSFRFSVSADSDVIGQNSSLSVGKILSGSLFVSAKTAVESKSEKSVAFDISLLDESGEEVQPDGDVSISTDLPEDFDKSKVSVYRLSDDGEKCYKLDSSVTGDRISFKTNHFSVFVISQDADSAAAVEYAPATEDDAPLAALVLVAVGTILAGAVNLKSIRSKFMA